MEFTNSIFQMIGQLSPAAAFVAIISATFVLEDVAIIGTALIAGGGLLDPLLGGAALLTGIVLGDIGLFWMGRGARKVPFFSRYVDTQTAQSFKAIGTDRVFSLVFTTRFVPGMRLPTYTGLGYVGTPFIRFLVAVIFAVTLWTVVLYSAVLFLGQAILEMLGPWKWVGVIAIVAVILLIERKVIKAKRRRNTALAE